jgi:RimJ/RimL family protein N-acetyltransferase
LFSYTSDPEVTRFLAIEPPSSLDDTRVFIAKCKQHRVQDREYFYVIADAVSDEALGIIGLRHIDPVMRTAQVGTWLSRGRWGTGTNAEAKRLLLEFAFDRLGLHRVEARIDVANDRSLRAFERLGGVREGVLRESFFKGGTYRDQYLYALLEPEWRRRQRMRPAARHEARTVEG